MIVNKKLAIIKFHNFQIFITFMLVVFYTRSFEKLKNQDKNNF
jgi:hypothetical protein